MKRTAALLLAVIPMLATAAEQRMRVTDLPLERCELREVIARAQFESVEKAAAIAEQALPLLDQLDQIASKATIPNKLIKDQLSPEDIGKFTELSQRLKTTQLAQLMESRRQRDLMVLEKMVMVADREYRWQDPPNEDNPDFIIYSALQLLRLTIEDKDISSPTSSGCTLEYALDSLEHEVISKINAGSARLEWAGKEFESILAKYRMKKLDRSRLSKTDLEKVNELVNDVIKPMQRHGIFFMDIEHIKLMARASEIIYESDKQDIAFGGGDIEAIGKTIQRRKNNNEFDKSTQIAIGLWRRINEKIPSEFTQELSESESTEKNNKKQE